MRKQYTPAQKAQIVLEVLKEEQTITQIASQHGVHPSQLCRWRDKAVQNLATLFTDAAEGAKANTAAEEAEIEKLYAEIGRLSTQLNWLKKKSGGQHE